MNISGIQNTAAWQVSQTTRAAEVQEPETAPAAGRQPVPDYDEYIPEDPAAKQTAGIYQVVPDEDGNPRLQFDGPPPDSRAESCTTNTDRVDLEIKQLNAEKEQLEQQINAAADLQKAEELKKQLAQVEQELRQKDNDAYRRQHAVVT